ncbi:hypothetical protein [Bdellovibrio sp. HCB209]|uniref:hypothetical protein n=1 Tax=Bdellovibrio sp. HCB209 TaxID=3394354 RepID=UPI0039B5DC0B
MNIRFSKIAILAGVLLLQPILDSSSQAFARKKAPMRAYSFIIEGGKASQGECDGEKKIPRLKKLKEFAKAGSYMGSELQTPEIKGKPGEEMWKHFFKNKPACNVVLAKTPSKLEPANLKDKPELPEDDSVDSEEETEQGQQATEPGEPTTAEPTSGADPE